MRLVPVIALALAACDTAGDAPEPLATDLLVSLTDDATLSLVTAEPIGCYWPIVAETKASSMRLTVRVLGIDVPERGSCFALTSSA